ncbi:TetR/AcrR family transcriptional regulator [Paenibacillus aurantiacus]|uniref:TetR/AcrR family transcriptional regulator n=1 Tax=Paenibacillus aurantiacus TaxID=1936118 RepID=A0ABV5KZU7_9BACL
MSKSYVNRRDSIVLTAIEIIHELGVQGLSTREIAKRQGVSEPALYRQFDSKSDILLAVLDHYTHYDHLVFETIKNQQQTSKQGVLFYIQKFTEYFENYPAITAVTMSFDFLTYEPATVDRVKEIHQAHYDFIYALVEAGKKAGEIKEAIGSEDAADTVYGLLQLITLRWRLSNFSFSLKERAVSAVSSYLNMC